MFKISVSTQSKNTYFLEDYVRHPLFIILWLCWIINYLLDRKHVWLIDRLTSCEQYMAAISKIRTCLIDYVDERWHYNWTTDRCCGYDRLLFFCNRQTTRSPNIRINIKLYLNVQRVWLWNHSARSCSPGVIHHIAQAQLAIGLYSYS